MSARSTTGAILSVAGVGVGVLALLRSRATFATVRGQSMSPTFTDGERVFAVKSRRYRVGDVIVFRPPEPRRTQGDPPWRIKRVAATAGEPVPAWLRDCDWATTSAAEEVPHGCVVVVGDHRRSEDSRLLGFVPLSRVRGRVLPTRPPPRPHVAQQMQVDVLGRASSRSAEIGRPQRSQVP